MPPVGRPEGASVRSAQSLDYAAVGLLEQVAKYGIAFVFGNVLLEQIGLPIPALPTLIVAGALAARGDLSAPLVLLVAVVASLIADLLWFALGRRQGYRVLSVLCRVSLSPDSCVNQTEAFFNRYGLASLLFAKFVPGFSTVAPPLAGASNASVASFMAWDAGGALLWAGSGFAAGAIFHRAVDRVLDVLASFGGGALVFVGSALVLFILWKYAQRRRFYRALRMARISPQEVSRSDRARRIAGDPGRPHGARAGGRSAPHPGRAAARARGRRGGPLGSAAGSRDHPLLHLTQRGDGGPCGPRADGSGVHAGAAARRRPRGMGARGLPGRAARGAARGRGSRRSLAGC